jgi:histidine triad (HIT) family protein
MDCVFCQIVAGFSPADRVFEDDISLAFLDKYPKVYGHMLLIPKAHYRWIYDCPDMPQLFAAAQKIIRAIIPVLDAKSVSIGTFGNEIPHAHIWIYPVYSRKNSTLEGKLDQPENRSKLAEKLRLAI